MHGSKLTEKDGTEYICVDGNQRILAEYFYTYMDRNWPSPINYHDILNTPINCLKIKLLDYLSRSLQEDKEIFAFFSRPTRKKEQAAVKTLLDVLCKRRNANSLEQHLDTLQSGNLQKMLWDFCWSNPLKCSGERSITPLSDFLEALMVNRSPIFGCGK